MKRIIAWILMVTAALVAASMLGVAAAESPTSTATPPHVVSVSGAGRAPIAQGAEQSAANAAYHQALTAAVEDGKGKAELLAADAGVTLAGVQSVIEGGGSVGCTALNAESEYAPYEGAEPDFGSGGVEGFAVAPRAAASTPVLTSPKPKPKKKKKKKPKGAKAASAAGCTVSADVSLIYTIA